jgi:Zn-dependent protease
MPGDSTQADWVRRHVLELGGHPIRTNPPVSLARASMRRLGPLAPFAVLLLKAKGLMLLLFKLKFLLSFAAFLWLYAAMFGWRFGLGLALSILVHELGHFLDIKRRGLPAEMPLFVPGLGAYVKWNTLGVTSRVRTQISLAGPAAGWIAALFCLLIYARTHDPVWAALARSGAILNLLNLIPVWLLDGGKAIASLAQPERIALLAVACAVGAAAWQPSYILVAGGIGLRLFTNDKPEREDWSSWLYYAALLAALGLVLYLAPAPTLK